MKKSRIANRVLVLTMAMFFIFATMTSAHQTSNVNFAPSEEFKDFVSNMYRDTTKANIINQSGEDMTFDFFNVTADLFLNEDWQSIYSYFYMNNLQLEYEVEPQYTAQRSGDLAKTQEKYCYALVYGVSGAPNAGNYSQEVTFLLRGTVFYNPNTMQITSVNKQILDTTVNGGGSIVRTNATSSHSGTRATISGVVDTNRVIGIGQIVNYTVKFQPAKGSLTISL